MTEPGPSPMAANPDRDVLAALLVQQMPALEAFVRLRMGVALRKRETGEDLVQTVCRAALESFDRLQFRGDAAFRSWLFGIAGNKLRERVRLVTAQRRDPARERPLDEMRASSVLDGCRGLCTPSRELQSQETLRGIEAAFDALPADQQEAVSLRRIASLDYAAIAAAMARSEGAVRNLVHRGLARFALLLEEAGIGPAAKGSDHD
ncbi:MAG TPA: RNA polymerase sigma factor [Planctomycetota bacterium]|nr:RNA polymerase sigma factor [Planctomycetota bacterium]